MMTDPFDVLGLAHDASIADVRAARRRLAFELHPDRGGSADAMRDLNAAFDAAIGHLTGRRPLFVDAPAASAAPEARTHTAPAEQSPPGRPYRVRGPRWIGRAQQDVPSFVIDALPAEAYEALLIVTSWIGEVLVDDPPYVLEVHLQEPSPCWCRLDLVPDAGASTVSLTVAQVGDEPAPLVDEVRDVWVANLNKPGAFP